ncbi:MAG TPA: zf-HC2 domain-containing protein [Terriglobales bacterium]|nr:zf-HC2 domain-containing protein [Terriglobales bacterium]
MTCAQAKSLSTAYLDGRLEGRDYHAMERHLLACAPCQANIQGLQQTQQFLSSLGRWPAPADLALRLRSAISREAAAVRRDPFALLRLRLENALNAFMVPATAGLLSAIVIFGLLIGFFALPAQIDDVPTMLYTPPELAIAPFGLSQPVNGESVVIEAYVDANGRVQDYRVLAAPESSTLSNSDLKNMLIFTVFRPATSFGRPTAGRAILSFSKVNVKG